MDFLTWGRGSGVVDRPWSIGWGWLGGIAGSRLRGIGSRLGIAGFTRVGHISNIARGGIRDSVGHGLGAAVGKGNSVGARGGITVTVLVGVVVDTSVVILNSVVVLY